MREDSQCSFEYVYLEGPVEYPRDSVHSSELIQTSAVILYTFICVCMCGFVW